MSEILEIRKRAHQFVQAGDLDSALEEYRKILKQEEVDPNIYNLMGDVYFKKGDKEAAFSHYEEAVKRYGEEKLYSNAIAVCRKMLRLDPDYLYSLRLLGELFLEQGFESEASNYFLELASKLIARGDLTRAVEALKRVIEFAPTSVKVREQLAEVYLSLGLNDEARSELVAASDLYARSGDKKIAEQLKVRAKELGGWDEPQADVKIGGTSDRIEIVHRRIGLAHHVPLDIDEVLASFQNEIRKAIGEEDYQSHYDLGISYLDLGLYDEALKEFSIARKHPKLTLRCIELAGRCFMEKGDYELAVEELTSGLELQGYSDEEYLGLRYDLAMAFEKLGNYDEAAANYEAVCRSHPDFRDAKEKLEELRKA